MPLLYGYATLSDLRVLSGLTDAQTGDDSQLRKYLRDATRILEQETRKKFYPRRETRYYDHPVNVQVLKLDDWLLEVETLTTQNGALTIAAADQVLACGTNRNVQPYDRIELKVDGTNTVFLYSGTLQRANAVTALWGYHEDYANAWLSANDTLKTGVDAAVTTLSVNDADGADLYGETPRFKAGQLIQIGTEFMYVTAVTAATTNTLTVLRGFFGTVAAAHLASDAIYIYQPMEDVSRACLDLAEWMYRTKGLMDQGSVGYPGLGVTIKPVALPTKVQEVIERYRWG
ncbi:MAG: hypothetical protein WC869_10355 [Phycisphaerae bacterium]|jgi:hypothetical protein